jgi:superfamily II DNA/RNA helicase
MIELLSSVNINLTIAEALKKEKIVVPTEVQRNVIPEILKNKDLIVESETGTGKTLAYLILLFLSLL